MLIWTLQQLHQCDCYFYKIILSVSPVLYVGHI